MNIFYKISEKSNNLISILDLSGFFNKPYFKYFCPKARLKIELEIKMWEKWNSIKNYNLTKTEFDNIIKSIIDDEVSETIFNLLESEKIKMFIDKNGNIVYMKSDNSGDYFQYNSGILKIFRKQKQIL